MRATAAAAGLPHDADTWTREEVGGFLTRLGASEALVAQSAPGAMPPNLLGQRLRAKVAQLEERLTVRVSVDGEEAERRRFGDFPIPLEPDDNSRVWLELRLAPVLSKETLAVLYANHATRRIKQIDQLNKVYLHKAVAILFLIEPSFKHFGLI